MDTEKDNQEDIDLSSAFNGSAKKPEEQPKSAQYFVQKNSKMVNWVIKYSGGLIKNQRMANIVLLILALILLIISFFNFYSQLAPKPRIPASEIINMPINNLP